MIDRTIIAIAFLSAVFGASTVARCEEFSGIKSPEITEVYGIRNVIIFEDTRWRVTREFPHDYIGVQQKDAVGGHWNSVALELEWRKRIHPMHVGSNDAGDLFIISYDLIDNLPSGRSRSAVIDGTDIWRIAASPEPEPERLASGLRLGGIDALVYASFSKARVDVCGDNRCYSWRPARKVVLWKTEALSDHEFIEVAFEENQAAALLRHKHDDRTDGALTNKHGIYAVAKLRPAGVDISPVEESGIPWGINLRNGRVTWRTAATKAELQRLFLYEWERMPLSGAMYFGSSNLEGRIAWGQTYYLGGLISVLEGAVKPLFPAPVPGLHNRVLQEVRLIADLCETAYPFYLSKRYSLDREPLASVLHFGRIAALLVRAQQAVDLPSRPACANLLKRALGLFEGTLEEYHPVSVNGQQLPYIGLRKGMPFWADGSNAPYNYVSAYVEGLLALGVDASTGDRLAGMLEVLRHQEFSEGHPYTWRYVGNIFDRGWDREDGVSINTPTWTGNNKALAHITYRTMDARAIFKLAQSRPNNSDVSLIDHLRTLTRTGWLLPSMNELFANSAGGGGRVPLSTAVARYHARASAPWALQSSVWALNQLAQDATE